MCSLVEDKFGEKFLVIEIPGILIPYIGRKPSSQSSILCRFDSWCQQSLHSR